MRAIPIVLLFLLAGCAESGAVARTAPVGCFGSSAGLPCPLETASSSPTEVAQTVGGKGKGLGDGSQTVDRGRGAGAAPATASESRARQFTALIALRKRSASTNSLKRIFSAPRLSRTTTVGRPTTWYLVLISLTAALSSSVASTRTATKRPASSRTCSSAN